MIVRMLLATSALGLVLASPAYAQIDLPSAPTTAAPPISPTEPSQRPEEFGQLYLDGVSPDCLNRVELEAWVRNAPAMLPQYPTPNADGLGRGMPYLGLSEEDIDRVVDYLATLQ